MAVMLSRKSSSAPPNVQTPVSTQVRTAISRVVKIIQTEEYRCQDPVIDFLKELIHLRIDIADLSEHFKLKARTGWSTSSGRRAWLILRRTSSRSRARLSRYISDGHREGTQARGAAVA
ncbi:hypothetical protein Hypma_007138 [Hypsizygus marmoreus]|uniref:Uncharacterized protein n=1 Tax=Hypsizygus marmoreus TaxID=39966 RepID=A0A369KET7_HYPMA|nr:hypothetical protein Hypma_007138 [Hypsizygus marmoreus]